MYLKPSLFADCARRVSGRLGVAGLAAARRFERRWRRCFGGAGSTCRLRKRTRAPSRLTMPIDDSPLKPKGEGMSALRFGGSVSVSSDGVGASKSSGGMSASATGAGDEAKGSGNVGEVG